MEQNTSDQHSANPVGPSPNRKDVSGVYPEPHKPQAEQAKLISVEPLKLPWVKIALLGWLAEIVAFIATVALLMNFDFALTFLLLTHGWGLYLIQFLAVALILYPILSNWHVQYPLMITAGSLVIMLSLYKLLITDPHLLLHRDSISGPIVIIGAIIVGPLTLIALTYLTNLLRLPSPMRMLLPLPFVALAIFAFGIAKAPKVELVTAASRDWAILPHYTISGTVGHWQNQPCEAAKLPANFDTFPCYYDFTQYPGYLTADSQAQIAAARKNMPSNSADYFMPSSYLSITVARQSSVFKPYMFAAGKCDIANLAKLAGYGAKFAAKQTDIILPEPVACAQAITPGGRTVYYTTDYESGRVHVPTKFYFEEKDSLVVLWIYDHDLYADTPNAIYYTDANYQPELFKFVDSFR